MYLYVFIDFFVCHCVCLCIICSFFSNINSIVYILMYVHIFGYLVNKLEIRWVAYTYLQLKKRTHTQCDHQRMFSKSICLGVCPPNNCQFIHSCCVYPVVVACHVYNVPVAWFASIRSLQRANSSATATGLFTNPWR